MTAPIDNFIAPACNENIEILHQDEHVLLINKPSGLLSLSGKNPLNNDSVHFRLVQQFPTVTLVHRLDFGTSGIMVLALSKPVNAHLTKQFQNRTVTKNYISILDGHLTSDQGVIDAPIAKDKTLFPRLKICQATGKQSSSHFQVLERLTHPTRSRVLFTPRTGRTHQLRIHSQSIGHPILGCDLYGTDQSQALSPRLMLHASTLEFQHPVSDKTMVVNCPCPF